MTEEELKTLLNVVLAVAAVASFLAASYTGRQAYKSAEANLEATRAKLLLHFLNRYGSEAMLRNLLLLEKWQDRNSEILRKWRSANSDEEKILLGYMIDRKSKDLTNFDELNLARRHVKRYFIDAHELFNEKLITRDMFKKICSVAGNEIFFDVVEPLDSRTIKYEEYAKHKYQAIRDVLAKSEEYQPPKGL